MIKKKLYLLISFGFVYGVLVGIFMIEELQNDFSRFLVYGYPLVLLTFLIYLNGTIKRSTNNSWIFPVFSFILYLPTNLLAGIYYDHYIRYHDNPRFIFLLYYILFLLVLYWLATIVDMIFHKRYGNIIYLITDILSLSVLPILTFINYFSAPA